MAGNSAAAERNVRAVPARVLIRPARPDDLEEALKMSVVHGIEDLPVVEEGKVIGNLDCFELIKGIKEKHKRAAKKKR